MRLPGVESAIEKLEFLEHDHVVAKSLHAEVEKLGQGYLANGILESPEVEAFRKAISSLVSIYKLHIRIEDELVFPLAAQLLSPAAKTAIAGEMAVRRNIEIVSAHVTR